MFNKGKYDWGFYLYDFLWSSFRTSQDSGFCLLVCFGFCLFVVCLFGFCGSFFVVLLFGFGFVCLSVCLPRVKK